MPEALNKPPEERTRLAEFEELVLLATIGLAEKAFGAAILKRLQAAGRSVSPGALYVTLGRLQEKGLISTLSAPSSTEQRGRPKAAYTVTATGREALQAVEAVRCHLRGSLPPKAVSAPAGEAGVLMASPPDAGLKDELPSAEASGEEPSVESVLPTNRQWGTDFPPHEAEPKPRKSPPPAVPWQERRKKAAPEDKAPEKSAFPSMYDTF